MPQELSSEAQLPLICLCLMTSINQQYMITQFSLLLLHPMSLSHFPFVFPSATLPPWISLQLPSVSPTTASPTPTMRGWSSTIVLPGSYQPFLLPPFPSPRSTSTSRSLLYHSTPSGNKKPRRLQQSRRRTPGSDPKVPRNWPTNRPQEDPWDQLEEEHTSCSCRYSARGSS